MKKICSCVITNGKLCAKCKRRLFMLDLRAEKRFLKFCREVGIQPYIQSTLKNANKHQYPMVNNTKGLFLKK
jgi:hypothetical protein